MDPFTRHLANQCTQLATYWPNPHMETDTVVYNQPQEILCRYGPLERKTRDQDSNWVQEERNFLSLYPLELGGLVVLRPMSEVDTSLDPVDIKGVLEVTQPTAVSPAHDPGTPAVYRSRLVRRVVDDYPANLVQVLTRQVTTDRRNNRSISYTHGASAWGEMRWVGAESRQEGRAFDNMVTAEVTLRRKVSVDYKDVLRVQPIQFSVAWDLEVLGVRPAADRFYKVLQCREAPSDIDNLIQ